MVDSDQNINEKVKWKNLNLVTDTKEISELFETQNFDYVFHLIIVMMKDYLHLLEHIITIII